MLMVEATVKMSFYEMLQLPRKELNYVRKTGLISEKEKRNNRVPGRRVHV